MKNVLNWGLLSTARINRAVIPPIHASPRSRLLAVGSRSAAAAQEYAARWGIPRAHGSYEALLADRDVDIIYISLPNSLHAEWTIKALEAGKHVLCEKPLAVSVAEVDAISAAAQRANRVAAEAFMYRHHPQTLKVQEIVDSGQLGEVKLVRSAFTFKINNEEDVRLKASLAGGSVWDLGCYPVSYARYVFGAEPEEAFGWQTTGAGGVDEYFYGQLRFPGGRVALFDSGFRLPFRMEMEIVGVEGSLSVPMAFKPGLQAAITLRRGEEEMRIAIAAQELYRGEVEDMADAALDGKAPRISLEHSRANVAAICALYASARSGQPARL
jgi:predicted dehydrogenase